MNGTLALFLLACAVMRGQETTLVKVEDAIARAKVYGGQIQSSTLAAKQAKEDIKQARAARLPAVSAFSQFIYTEGNGTPSGVFVANDGVHVYNEQAVVHQELLAIARHGEIDRALAAEAVATARTEIAARGLAATVITDYYAVVAGQRKLRTARTSLEEAEKFRDLTQKLERGGEVARADVIKSQIELQQRQRDVTEATLAINKAKVALGVIIFPSFTTDFEVADNFEHVAPMPNAAESHMAAVQTSPDLKAAAAGVRQAGYEVAVARYQWLPSFALDFFYGIDANQLAARTDHPTPATGRSTLPNYEVTGRQNLGYVAQATLNIPVWNWGATRSKIKQAEYKEEQAKLDLSLARRAIESNTSAAYLEAQGAERQLASLSASADLSAESLRLTVLRYQAGEATAFEVVDAQNTLVLARNSYDDGLVRYQIALANLRLTMGTL